MISRNLKAIALVGAFVMTAGISSSQTALITDPDFDQASPLDCSIWNNGSVQNFFDSGGQGGNYGANENETITFCPDLTNGCKVTVAFATNAGYMWNVDASDTVYIYDGPNTGSPLMDKINSSSHPNGATFQASTANASGCITVQFISDGAVETAGWDANVSCGNPPQPFEAHMVAYINGDIAGGDDLSPPDTGYVDVCQNDSIMFVATPVFPYDSAVTGCGYGQAGAGQHDIEWFFSDGTSAVGDTVWFHPPSAAGFLVTLLVSDHFPQTEGIIAKVRVSTTPDFSSCMAFPDDTVCVGNTTGLIGGITAQDTAGVDPTSASILIGGQFAGLVYLPDGSGQQYLDSLFISGFPPGDTISAGSDILSFCVSIEHSYLGDLEMTLTCPNGQTATIFNSFGPGGMVPGGFNGGGTFLGCAYDNNLQNPGECWEYCWYDAAPNPSWAMGYPTTPVTNPPCPSNGTSVVAGDYQPEDPFSAFIGCPINGNWTITVQDNLGIDDGYICQWGITYDPLLNPNNETYAPSMVSEAWTPDPDFVSGQNDTTLIVAPSDTGWNYYQFVVLDDFGCYYDTTIGVFATPGPQIMPDTIACNNQIQVSGTASGAGGTWTEIFGPGTSSFTPGANVDNPQINVTEEGIYIYQYIDVYCGDTLQVQVEYLPDPTASLLDTFICEGDVYMMDITYPNSVYQWFHDAIPIVGANGATYGATAAGTYTGVVQNVCGTASANAVVTTDPCLLTVPNVFTPNGDGTNDFFVITGLEIYLNNHLQIYNRWGNLIYENTDYENNWDGTTPNGQKAADGTYFFILNTTRPFTLEDQLYQGTVNIFRE